ncbi:MAG: DUF4325 domain-containing protein [Rhodospirillales bacterium]|nr:DUF4325 domain-containing protein [Rhodospirillales bacterium]
MPRASRQNPEVRDFILRNVAKHPGAIGSLVAQRFNLSRAAISRYVHRLIDEGLLEAEGKTNARRYRLKTLREELFAIEIFPGLPEHHVFRFRILPHLEGVAKNVIDICQYGFTEMLNNVVDHSGSAEAIIQIRRDYARIEMTILDKGVGIFEKIKRDFHLPDYHSALLELSKGKLTSDAARHSGEGIFFTSRMFDTFSILSGHLFYFRERQDDAEWLIGVNERPNETPGTSVIMSIATDADWTTAQVFAKYQGDNLRFRNTHVPIKLAPYPGEELVSRSQAKRILARFDQFSEVILDFEGVPTIGQAFADEIFRVYANQHPDKRLVAVGTTPEVARMIAMVTAASGTVPPNVLYPDSERR